MPDVNGEVSERGNYAVISKEGIPVVFVKELNIISVIISPKKSSDIEFAS